MNTNKHESVSRSDFWSAATCRRFQKRGHVRALQSSMILSRTAKSLVPIFPHRFQSATAKDCGDFGGRTFVADLKLAGGELIFSVLVFGRNNATAHGAMEMFAALTGVTPRTGVNSPGHHRYTEGNQRIT